MKNPWKKLHLAGVVGALTTLGGLAAAVEKIPALTETTVGRVATAIVAIGAAIQAVTRAVHKGDVVELPKPNHR